MKQFIPILNWLPSYKKENLKGDVFAGLTVGIMLIPQGMAYAMIAGLPPVYGLYASLIPQIIYAIFGTSRQLSVGPVAMDSLLVAAGVSVIATAGTENYIALTLLLSLMMGAIQLIFGMARMGFLVNFLSQPVISGFTSAAALVIGLNQLKHLIGVDLVRSNSVFSIIQEAFLSFDQINWATFFIGIVGIILIKVLKKINKAIPAALVVVTLSILVVYFLQLSHLGVKVLGEIPAGFPTISIPDLTNKNLQDLIPVAFTLALIAFMETISVAKAIQTQHKKEYTLDANQEMIGLGMANIIGSFFSSYPTTGGFSRSAVNDQAGAKTNLAAIISSGLIALTLLFLTPLFYYLPKAVLASIIMVAVFGLIDWKYPKYLYKTSKKDLLMLIVTFAVTLGLGIKEGIGIGVLVSLATVIYQTTQPHIAVLGKLPDTIDYRNIERFDDAEIRKDVLILRQDGRLYFANVNHFAERVRAEVQHKGEDLKLLIFHCGSLSSIDSTALQVLKELIEELNENGVGVYFSGVIGPVRDYFHKTCFSKEVGEKHFFLHVQLAIDYLDNGAKKRSKQMLKKVLQTNVFEE